MRFTCKYGATKSRILTYLRIVRLPRSGPAGARRLGLSEGRNGGRLFDRAAYMNQWRKDNRAHVRELKRKWYWENHEKALEQIAVIRKKNVSKFKERNRKYRLSKPHITRWNSIKQSSLKRGLPLLITRKEFLAWFLAQERKCHYCGLVDLKLDNPTTGGEPITLTIDRMNSELPYSLENICMACWRCNDLKGRFFTHDQWMDIAERYVRPYWMNKQELLNAN